MYIFLLLMKIDFSKKVLMGREIAQQARVLSVKSLEPEFDPQSPHLKTSEKVKCTAVIPEPKTRYNLTLRGGHSPHSFVVEYQDSENPVFNKTR